MSETVLAFDVGARRIGVAVGNDLLRQAQAAAIVDADVADEGFGAIDALVRTWRPERLVVGMPLPVGDAAAGESGGRTNAQSLSRCERFATRLAERFDLPVERVDERYSSIDADALQRDRRRAGARRARAIDDLAAAVILQRWLDALPTS